MLDAPEVPRHLLLPCAPLPEWAVPPRYDGWGFANVPNSILAHFGLPMPLPPVAPEALPPLLLDGVRTIAVVLIDALGYDTLVGALRGGVCPALARVVESERGHLSPLATVFPSTTATALTTLATADAPVRHGMVGYSLWLRDIGSAVEMITFRPLAGSRAGPDPAGFLPLPTVFERLAAVGVDSHYVNARRLLGSGLSVMHSKGATVHGVHSFADLCGTLRGLLDEGHGGMRYIQAYWDSVDGIEHQRGPGSPHVGAELAAIDFSLGREVLDQLRRDDVAIILTADHGQCATSTDRAVWLNAAPDLLADLRHPPTGERRVVYLDPLPGRGDAIGQWLGEHAAEAATVVDRESGLRLGLWGPPPAWDEAVERLGELIALANPGWQLPSRDPARPAATPPVGAHGNLTRDEALVPLVTMRLG